MAAVPGLCPAVRDRLLSGAVIPAHPLALDARRRLDERRQRALTRYYLAAGAGGIAVGVHTTQFAIRDSAVGLYEPVLALAAETADEWRGDARAPVIRIAGIVGPTRQAVAEARAAADLGYHLGLLSYGGIRDSNTVSLLDRARAVAEAIPLMGFYLQPAVGGIPLGYEFWREFCEIENAVAIKVAPFNRYATLEVMRAVCDSGRAGEIALYTGNDDNIVSDLLMKFAAGGSETGFVGGLLGHWAIWTRPACRYWQRCRQAANGPHGSADPSLLWLNAEVTDANAAVFDVRNAFAGCIAGIHEVLRRQGLMQGTWCLNKSEGLSAGQIEEIDRVCRAYPHLADDEFVAENLDTWLR